VDVARNAPCPCGSGLKYKKCHGLTRDEERAMRRRLDALGEAHDLGALFPFLRPRGRAVEAFADRLARELGGDDLLVTSVAPGLEHIGSREQRRLVTAYAERFAGPWETLCADVGDCATAERALVVGALRAAVADRLLPPRGVLEEVERAEDAIDTPEKALLFILPPNAVWSLLDAIEAAEATGPDAGRLEQARAIDDVAAERLDEEHALRVQGLARHIARGLPLVGLPRTSALLADACKAVALDRELAAELAVYLLAAYVVRLGAESARAGAPT
jgi:hypothetical protein